MASRRERAQSFAITLTDRTANLEVLAGQDLTSLGIVQVSAEDPDNWTVAGSTVDSLHQFLGPLAGLSVPVVIRWQVRDLV